MKSKERGGMEDSRHYKARLEEAMTTLKMSGAPLAKEDKA